MITVFVPTMIADMAGGQIAIKFGAQGSCIGIVTACATATHSLGEAYRAIKHGYTDAVIAGGTDHCAIAIGAAAFGNARALTRAENPKHASLPFNADRGGFVMADGAAVLILEEMEHAIARGAHIYAEMVGYGSTCDAYHATAPRPDGSTQARCISMAAQEAGYDAAKDTVYVNAHGTGTQLNDVAETKAYNLAFGQDAPGTRKWNHTAYHQPGQSRPRVRSGLHPEQSRESPAHTGTLRLLRLRRAQCVHSLQEIYSPASLRRSAFSATCSWSMHS